MRVLEELKEKEEKARREEIDMLLAKMKRSIARINGLYEELRGKHNGK